MKIRTDFVTNSSSSSFVVEIDFKLKDGSSISYYEIGQDGERDPVVDQICISSSPRQLGISKSVEDMINLLKSSVTDFPYDDNPKRLFDETHPEVQKILSGEYVKTSDKKWKSFSQRQKKAHEKAQDFIKSLENIKDMDEIEEITISGNERNYMNYDRTYTYNLVTGDYSCIIKGQPFEKNGAPGGALWFNDANLAKRRDSREVIKKENKKAKIVVASVDNSLEGLTFVVTGDVNTFSSRNELKEFIEARGGKLTGSVSSKTNYLITNTPDSGTKKNREAHAHGVEIITEEQFRKMVE